MPDALNPVPGREDDDGNHGVTGAGLVFIASGGRDVNRLIRQRSLPAWQQP